MSELLDAIVSTLRCPKCGNQIFNEDFKKDGLYLCGHRGPNGGYCNTILACYCKGCNQLYNEDRFGKHGDVYECKECGRVQWGLTEFKKRREEGQRIYDNIFESAKKAGLI